MGSYLDKPETTKKSQTDENDFVELGSSSMQGWRINQEDAHNSIPNFAEKTAFFAVYDGHGGSEVAEYCSMKLPDYLKDLESFKKGDYEQALKDAFIGFDATLLQEPVLALLKEMAQKNPDYDDTDMEEDEEAAEEIVDLHEEATMPLKDVLEKYKGGKPKGDEEEKPKRSKTQRSEVDSQNESSSATAAAAGPRVSRSDNKKVKEESAGPSSSSSGGSSSSSSNKSSNAAAENEVSSSSGKANSNSAEESETPSSSTTSIKAQADQAPDSTHSIPATVSSVAPTVTDEVVVAESSNNGNSKKSTDDDSAITSSQENGEVSNNCSSSGPAPSTAATTITTTATAASACGSSSSTTRIPNQISSSVGNVEDTESGSSTDEEERIKKNKMKVMKQFEKIKKSLTSGLIDGDDDDSDEMESDEMESDDDDDDDDDDDEDIDEEDLSNEELSGDDEEEGNELDDEFMFNMEKGPGKASGCTAVVALLAGRELFVANAGDSRCVVCRGGKVVEMSFDHKPEDDIEFQRIRKAGGRVSLDGRVNGGLNLSRAIGDHGYKMNKELAPEEQMISAMPDIKRIVIEPEDEFMVLACDGIWNYMSNEEVIGFVKTRIEQGKLSLAQICEELFHNCLAPNTMGDGTGCDNMTAIIVKFKPALKELPAPPSAIELDVTETNAATAEIETIKATKRTLTNDEDNNQAEALVEPSEKRQKIEEDLTPSAVDTSTTT